MYLLGIKQSNVYDGNNEKGYVHPINIVKASVEKQDIFDKIKELVLDGYKQNRLVMLQEIPYGIDFDIK